MSSRVSVRDEDAPSTNDLPSTYLCRAPLTRAELSGTTGAPQKEWEEEDGSAEGTGITCTRSEGDGRSSGGDDGGSGGDGRIAKERKALRR